MPFIVQCPHANCRKYMLLEDHDRGRTVRCLCCRQPVKLDPSPAERPAESPAAASQPQYTVLTCPQCQAPLRVPPLEKQQAVQCPRCEHVFGG